jgi:hypothetical protein
LIFDKQNGKVVQEGDLFKYFFDNLNVLKEENPNQNLGWELIRKCYPESLLQKICTEKNPSKYYKIMFLNE